MKSRNFNEIYGKLLKEKNPMLDSLHTRLLFLSGIIIGVLVLFFLGIIFSMLNEAIMLIFSIIEFFSVVTYIVTATKYRSLYKQNVIANLVRAYCSDLQFNHIYGISSTEYNRADYREYYDRFHSEDLIYGNIDNEFNVRMSEVKTEREERTTDSRGNTYTHYITVFQGIYGYIDVKNKFLPHFEVTSNSFFGKYDRARIEVDSAEFEKSYDLYSDDKIRTMEIFTSDLIEYFNNFKQNLNTPIQIKISNGTLFFRLRMNNSFESPTFGKVFDFESMYRNFKLIDEPLQLFAKIFENAKDVQF